MSPRTKCLCCEEVEPEIEVHHLPCGQHALSPECLKVQVALATQQERHYPLCCGGSIYDSTPVAFIEGVLSKDLDAQQLLERFQDRLEEYRAPPAQRTYCSNSSCHAVHGGSRYLGAEGSALKCASCHAMTCCLCKKTFHSDMVHICEMAEEKDKAIAEYITSLPEDERWLYQQCPTCSRWVEKCGACNHMTCPCSAQFCLVCGKTWKGLASCHFGCPKYAPPEYDEDGYNQHGFHPDTGLDRDGAPWDPNHEHEVELPGLEPQQENNAGNWDGIEDWVHEHINPVFDEDEFDQFGWNVGGFNRDGYTAWDFDADGYDRDGYNADGHDRAGYDREGFDADGHPNMD